VLYQVKICKKQRQLIQPLSRWNTRRNQHLLTYIRPGLWGRKPRQLIQPLSRWNTRRNQYLLTYIRPALWGRKPRQLIPHPKRWNYETQWTLISYLPTSFSTFYFCNLPSFNAGGTVPVRVDSPSVFFNVVIISA
jgi:hypothetical protein